MPSVAFRDCEQRRNARDGVPYRTTLDLLNSVANPDLTQRILAKLQPVFCKKIAERTDKNMQTADITSSKDRAESADWHRSLANAVRDPDQLVDLLKLPDSYRNQARKSAELFPLMVPHSFLDRMEPGNPEDPLLLQVLPLDAEQKDISGFVPDALHEHSARTSPGMLQKYAGRALLIATGTCAVHCRYCFRKNYPYSQEPRRLEDWNPALQAIAEDDSLREVILSGGDPLMLTDARLAALCAALETIPHLKRLRIHTRLPIVLPDRVTESLIEMLTSSRLTPIMVVHANHPREIVGECARALRTLVRSGMTVLNQAVLLRRINDSAEVLAELCERLVDLGVMPYYLHQLDRVSGTAHFEVPESEGCEIIEQLRRRLPGYAVPQYVREVPGMLFKIPLSF
jgi:EF-P beta-lysylation protein EpmB